MTIIADKSRELAFNKILVIRFSSLGDIILTTPLLKILRQQFPDSQIEFCTKMSFAPILRHNPNLNKILEVADDIEFSELRRLKKKITSEHYDLIIDLHNNLRTFYLKLFLRFRTKVLVFNKYSFRKFLLVKFKINLMKELPGISQRYIDVQHKTIPVGQRYIFDPEIYTNENDRESVNILIRSLNITASSKLICIVPSSRHFTKSYPAEYYVDLINKFDVIKYSFLLVGKDDDKNNINLIKSKTGDNVYDLCDKLNLLELAELMKRCTLVISGDTGPMHFAEAVAVPIIMLAGSSVKEFGFYPRNDNRRILEVNGLSCRPCSHIGRDSCPKGHFKCMKEIEPEIVFEEAMRILQ